MKIAEEKGDKLKYKKIEGMSMPYVEVEMGDGELIGFFLPLE